MAATLVAVLLLPGASATPLDAAQIAREVDFVNRFRAVRNISYGTDQHPVNVLDLAVGRRQLLTTLQRWRRNDLPAGPVGAQDLVIFTGSKLRGTGILVTDYRDAERARDYRLWLPELRKVRRMSEPDPAERWGNSNFTYGDIYIRRPEDEQHTLIGRERFAGCLGAIDPAMLQPHRRLAMLPAPDCSVDGRPVVVLRSRPLRSDLDYDERLVWIDAETFADYRSEYRRDGVSVKVIDKSWRSMGLDDPRAQYWVYWYARSAADGHEGMAFVDADAVHWNGDLDPRLWSERSLREIRR